MGFNPFVWGKQQAEAASIPVHPFEQVRAEAEAAAGSNETEEWRFYGECCRRIAAGEQVDAVRFRKTQLALGIFDEAARADVDRVRVYRQRASELAKFQDHAATQQALQLDYELACAERDRLEKALPDAQKLVWQSYDALCAHAQIKTEYDALRKQYPYLCVSE